MLSRLIYEYFVIIININSELSLLNNVWIIYFDVFYYRKRNYAKINFIEEDFVKRILLGAMNKTGQRMRLLQLRSRISRTNVRTFLPRKFPYFSYAEARLYNMKCSRCRACCSTWACTRELLKLLLQLRKTELCEECILAAIHFNGSHNKLHRSFPERKFSLTSLYANFFSGALNYRSTKLYKHFKHSDDV